MTSGLKALKKKYGIFVGWEIRRTKDVKILTEASEDKDRYSRFFAAMNLNCPYRLLLKLACDENKEIREKALERL